MILARTGATARRLNFQETLAFQRGAAFHTQTGRLLKDSKSDDDIKDDATSDKSQEKASAAKPDADNSESPPEGELKPRPRDPSAWTKRSQDSLRKRQTSAPISGSRLQTSHYSPRGNSHNERDFKKSISNWKKKIPSPKELKTYLDQYSIGQDTAKKHFSVAIYNHCIRMEDRIEKQEALYAAMEYEEEHAKSMSITLKLVYVY